MELNRIYHGDCRNMDKIDSNSVHLTVTSPPYFLNKDYEDYLPKFSDYLQMLYGVFAEVVRVTVPGGKICINLGDIAIGFDKVKYNLNWEYDSKFSTWFGMHKKPVSGQVYCAPTIFDPDKKFNPVIDPEKFVEEIPIMPSLVDYLRTIDTYLHARIIWEKDDPWANSSHVSFHSKIQHAEYRMLPAWESLFVFRKGKTARIDKSPVDGRFIDKEEWKKLVHGVWKIRSVQKNDFHEAMFPEELVANCIKLYSFPGDIVLDNFSGSGTTAAVAKKLGRNYVGYDIESKYVRMAEGRIASINESMIQDTPEYRDKTVNRKELQGSIFDVPV